MPDLEVSELIFLIIATIPFIMSYWIVKARRDILKYLPGYYCIYMTFLSTNLEALFLPDVFNFLEHFCLMLAGLFMLIAISYDFYTKLIKPKLIESNQNQGGVRK
ncbi:MAG: hypothetical protein ACFFDN_34860 [Candidatus Hodarchaeota archaeon]